MDYVKRILGEADEEDREKKKPDHKEREKPKDKEPSGNGEPVSAPEDSVVDELANLWRTGNKDDVTQRFMSMDNETAVKVVFAIGREGALELARMADLMLEQTGAEGEDSTEPAAVEGPESYPVRDIIGSSPEHLRQFRQDRAASPEGEAVRQHLGMS